MGLTSHDTAFLFGCKKAGVNFSRLLTLGRQEFFPSKKPLLRIFAAHGIGRDIDELIVASDGYADEIFRMLGAQTVESLDSSSYEGATAIHDLNQPAAKSMHERYTVVYDGGTLGHVFNIAEAFRSCMQMVKVGGWFISSAEANNYMGHGFYQFSPELLYRVFSEENGFRVRAMLLFASRGRGQWFKAIDPAQAGRRIELTGGGPLHLLCCAQKITAEKVFISWPQQSDYVREWGGTAQKKQLSKTTRSIVKALVPEKVRALIRPHIHMRKRSRLHRRTDAFVAIAHNDVILGKWQ